MMEIPYANYVGGLMYLMIYIRQDLAYSVTLISKYMGNLVRAI